MSVENESVENLNNKYLEILQEIGNIGAGNATTALAKMINKKVDMGIPQVRILEFKNIGDILGGAENLVVGILFNIVGDINGMMMYVLEQNSAHSLVNILMGRDIKNASDFDEMDFSALQELGNILTSSYLSSLSTLTQLEIKPQSPQIAFDMAGAILSVPAIEFGKVDDRVLFIESAVEDGLESVGGYFILVADVDSFKSILKSLGVM
jgi:chemotaxis protein CheC